MEHAILHENIDGQQVDFYPETGFDDVMQTDGDDEITLRMVLEGMDAAIALLQNGLATKANAADVYTKAEANNLLNNKANSSDLDNYLSKSGGTMSGDILVESNSPQILVRKANETNKGLSLFFSNSGNRGIYDIAGDKWLVYRTDDDSSPKIAATPATTDNSTKIATTAYVKSNLANYLSLSGGIVNSNVVIYSTSSNQLSVRNSSDDNVSTSTPTRDIYAGIYSYDKLGNTLGNVRFLNGQSGIISELVVQNRPHDKQTQIRIGYDNNGKVFTYAPKPAVTDNGDQIATASFVKDASVNTVNLSASSTYNNEPWKLLAMNFDTLPQNKFIGGTINTGGLSCYSGFRTGGRYASFILHAYNVGKIYHVWCEDGTWKYHQFTMGTATTFTV